MFSAVPPFIVHWAIMSLALWLASHLFTGIKFSTKRAVLIAALLLGFANAVVKPVLIFLTFPLTILTLGFFLLVINALMMLLVARLVSGFQVAGFWTAFFASIFISLVSFTLTLATAGNEVSGTLPGSGVFI